MQKITNDEAKEVQGGIGFWAGVSLVGLGIFIVGVFDGFTRPLRCR